MSFTESVATCFKKYVTFEGRASRSEYWWFFALVTGVNVLLGSLYLAVFVATMSTTYDGFTRTYTSDSPIVGLLFLLLGAFNLATLLPFLAAGSRRLHDTGKSAAFLLFYLLLGIGHIILIVLCAMEPNRGPNLYGPDPLAPGQPAGLAGPYAQPYGSQPYGAQQQYPQQPAPGQTYGGQPYGGPQNPGQ